MKTISVDLAAWLYLCNIEPTAVAPCVINGRTITEFTYDRHQRPGLGDAIRAFDTAHVPVRAFTEARARMKDWRTKDGRKLDGARRAYQDARWQTMQQDPQQDHDALLEQRRR